MHITLATLPTLGCQDVCVCVCVKGIGVILRLFPVEDWGPYVCPVGPISRPEDCICNSACRPCHQISINPPPWLAPTPIPEAKKG